MLPCDRQGPSLPPGENPFETLRRRAAALARAPLRLHYWVRRSTRTRAAIDRTTTVCRLTPKLSCRLRWQYTSSVDLDLDGVANACFLDLAASATRYVPPPLQAGGTTPTREARGGEE